jgi:hypothetical protein
MPGKFRHTRDKNGEALAGFIGFMAFLIVIILVVLFGLIMGGRSL